MKDEALAAIAAKTKPPGSLGRLEDLAVDLAVFQGTLRPEVDPARLVVFGADHGVTAEGVSAYPAEVTGQMMANLAGGGAAACVLTRALGVGLEIVDVGVAADLSGVAGICHAKVRRGTESFTERPAMSTAECNAALEAGRAAARRAADAGCRTLAVGDMGIGNTTAAAALASALTGAPPEHTVGRGTGVDDRTLARKRDVVGRALALHARPGRNPEELLAALGGLEIAAIAGAVMEGAACGMVVVLDGYISSAAGLAAVRMSPDCHAACVLSHRSLEPGHAIVIDALGGRPLLDLGMRLGEGTGAVLAIPLLRAAAAVLREMATFESAGVSGPAA